MVDFNGVLADEFSGRPSPALAEAHVVVSYNGVLADEFSGRPSPAIAEDHVVVSYDGVLLDPLVAPADVSLYVTPGTELFANGARGRLLTAVTPYSQSFTLRSGQGALFPGFGAGDFAWATIEYGPALNPTRREIVKITARSGDVLSIDRAQQNTLAFDFPAGSRVELRLTAATIAGLQSALGLNRRLLAGGIVPVSSGYDLFGSLVACVATAGTAATPTSTSRGTASNRRAAASTAIVNIRGVATNDSSVLGLRGRAPNTGGFEVVNRLLLQLDAGAAAKFFGIAESTSTDFLPIGTDPTDKTTTAMVGFGQQRTTPVGTLGGTWQLYHHNGAGGPVTQIDTGIQKVIDNLIQIRIWSLRGRASFFVELIDFDAQTRFFAELTANIPGPNSPQQVAWCSRSSLALSDGWSCAGIWHYQW